MSADYTAHAVVGIRILGSTLGSVVGTRPSCEHPQRVGNAYCPVCGKRVADEEVEGYEYADALRNMLPASMDIFQPGSNVDRVPDFIVGVGVSCDSENDERDPAPVPDAYTVRNALRGALEPHGLWDESQFGLHAALYVSV